MLSSTARQALKRATLYRLHSPLTVSPKVRRASSSASAVDSRCRVFALTHGAGTSPSAGSSRYKALRYAAGGFAAAGGASGAEWGRGGPDGSSSGTKDGPTQQLGALREEKDSGEDEDGDDTGKEDEEKQKTTVAKGKGKAGSSDAEAREEDGFVQEGEGPQGHKKREKGKGKELPRPKKRLRTDGALCISPFRIQCVSNTLFLSQTATTTPLPPLPSPPPPRQQASRCQTLFRDSAPSSHRVLLLPLTSRRRITSRRPCSLGLPAQTRAFPRPPHPLRTNSPCALLGPCQDLAIERLLRTTTRRLRQTPLTTLCAYAPRCRLFTVVQPARPSIAPSRRSLAGRASLRRRRLSSSGRKVVITLPMTSTRR